MKKNKLNKRFEEDIWGLITLKGKRNKVTQFMQGLVKERFNYKDKKNIVYRVEVTKPKRKKLVLNRYGKLLFSRRKLSIFYGGLRKRELESIVRSVSVGKGLLSDAVVDSLESRLESVVFRLHFANSVKEARKDIMRGVISVNKLVIKVPSFNVKVGDIIEVNPGYRNKVYNRIMDRVGNGLFYTNVVPYLEVNYKILAGCKIMPADFRTAVYPFKLEENYFKSFITNKG